MSFLASVAIAAVAALHTAFFVLEAMLWTRPLGRSVFGTTTEFAHQSRVLAANQGLYNLFLAAGLIWSLWPVGAPGAGKPIAVFFLLCVIVAGVFGALTVSRRILNVQALPGLLALVLVLLF